MSVTAWSVAGIRAAEFHLELLNWPSPVDTFKLSG